MNQSPCTPAHEAFPRAEETAIDQKSGRREHGRIGGLVTAALAVLVVAGLIAYFVTPKPSTVLNPITTSGTAAQAGDPGAGLPKLEPGRSAPSFDLQNLRGGATVPLAASVGHPVVLNFFASWCGSCRAELSAFAQVWASPHGQVQFVGVDTLDPNPGNALALLTGAGDSYPVGIDRSGSAAGAQYLVQALPVTVFIGPSGRIVGQVFGTQTASSLRPWVQRLQALDAEAPR